MLFLLWLVRFYGFDRGFLLEDSNESGWTIMPLVVVPIQPNATADKIVPFLPNIPVMSKLPYFISFH
jgi:hypothetical protein